MNLITTDSIRHQLVQNSILVDANSIAFFRPRRNIRRAFTAMRYFRVCGWKGLRPTLCLEAGRLFGGDEKSCFVSEARWS